MDVPDRVYRPTNLWTMNEQFPPLAVVTNAEVTIPFSSSCDYIPKRTLPIHMEILYLFVDPLPNLFPQQHTRVLTSLHPHL